MPSASLSPCGPPPKRLDALATNPGEICGFGNRREDRCRWRRPCLHAYKEGPAGRGSSRRLSPCGRAYRRQLSFAGEHQPRINGIAEFSDNYQVIHSPARCLGGVSWVLSPDEVGLPPVFAPDNSVNSPYSVVHASRILTAFGQKPDLVAPAYGPIGKLGRLGNVTFEIEAEGAAAGQRLHLPIQIGGKIGIEPVYPTKQAAQPGHEHLRAIRGRGATIGAHGTNRV